MTSTSAIQTLLLKAAQIQHLERGKLSVIRNGPDGPYFNHQVRVDGKNVTRYVPREQVAAVRQAIEGYKEFQSLVELYVAAKVEQTRSDMAAGVKKKKSCHS